MTEQQRKVLEFAESKIGQRVGDGECWTLAERALEDAGANTSNDLQKVVAGGNYIWGDEITASSAQPGDIVQFRDGFSNVKTVRKPDGSEKDSGFVASPNHTAIVKKIVTTGRTMTLIGQNLPVGESTIEMDFHFKSFSYTEGANTIDIKTRGIAKFYRPQVKSARKRK